MKYNLRNMAVLLCVGLISVSCNETDRFEKEQYEKIVYALSYTDQAFPISHMMTGETSIGYVSVGLSGTLSDNEDIIVEFERDPDALERYNILNFDLDETKYAKELTAEHFSIPDYKAVIKAGEVIGTMPIEFHPEGLSPDSIYMVPLRIKSVSKYTVNEELQSVLYRIMLENEYASQEDQTTYFMKGAEIKEDGEIMIAAGKRVFPLMKNQIRTTVHTKPYKDDAIYIRENSMIITIQESGELSIVPVDKDFMEIELVGGAAANYYGPDVAGVNRFNLCYKYRTCSFNSETGESEWSEWKTIRENLKRQ